MQEGLIDAASSWSRDGVPDHPLGWLTTSPLRRYVDMVRSDIARENRERRLFEAVPPDNLLIAPADAEPVRDDLLELLFLCCHPALTAPSQMALTLRAVAGLTTAEIAAAFLVPDKTMGQRISRAKQRLRDAGARFELPPDDERGPAIGVVLHVLYLLFNEGYSASAGPELRRPDLTAAAIRLTRRLHERLPDPSTSSGTGPSTSSGTPVDKLRDLPSTAQGPARRQAQDRAVDKLGPGDNRALALMLLTEAARRPRRSGRHPRATRRTGPILWDRAQSRITTLGTRT